MLTQSISQLSASLGLPAVRALRLPQAVRQGLLAGAAVYLPCIWVFWAGPRDGVLGYSHTFPPLLQFPVMPGAGFTLAARALNFPASPWAIYAGMALTALGFIALAIWLLRRFPAWRFMLLVGVFVLTCLNNFAFSDVFSPPWLFAITCYF